MLDQLTHWKLSTDEAGHAELCIENVSSSVNVLDSQTLDEFEQILNHFEQHPPQSLVIRSTRKAGFLAGADVTEFQTLSSRDAILHKIERGQKLFMRLRRLSFRTVAAIHGHCLGGGLELALACDYRVVDEDSAQLGLPEVKLGIHPGYGGVVRLTGLINPFTALTLMLEGRTVDGRTAKRLGIVDESVPERHLLDAAKRIAQGRYQPKRTRGWISGILDLRLVRYPVAAIVRRNLVAKVNPEHYPAPFRLLELWRDLPRNSDMGMRAEADSFAALLADPQASATMQNLVRVFLLDRELRSRAKKCEFSGQRVHVIGAGVMGGDIAAWSALRGFQVTLQDAKMDFIGPAIKRAATLFQQRLKLPAKVTAAMDRLMPDPEARGVAQADLVIEAITERLDAKQGLYAATEPKMQSTALLASNTSSLPLEQLSEKLERPGQMVGIHFFNPVAKMQLVEVVRGKNSSDEAIEKAIGFVSRLGKLPVEVASQPGFLVNRVLMAYLSEAMRLFDEGIAPELIDAEAVRFGMPMGPIELADTVGLDICKAVAHELNQAYGGDDSATLGKLVAAGKLGRKSGQGFYLWKNGKAKKATLKSSADHPRFVQDRLVFSLLNEAVQALSDGVVADRDTLDMAMIFGTGFPPFRGGPMHYIETLGKSHCLDAMQLLVSKGWTHFSPKPGWEEWET